MLDNVKTLYLCFSLITSQFYKWIGLIASLFLGLSLINLIFLPLTSNSIRLLLNVLITILIIFLWLAMRRIPTFHKEQIGILFGPSYQDEISIEISDLKDRLHKLIREKDFVQTMSIKRLPPNQKTSAPIDNIRILQKANARVLICGNFEKFSVRGKEITGFTSLTISYDRLAIQPREIPLVLGDAIAGRQLGWDSENTIHRNVVANNLAEIARFIVGIALITDSRFKDAETILGHLLLDVKAKYNQKRLPIEIKRFKNTVSNAYTTSLVEDVRHQYLIELNMNENLLRLNDSVINTWKEKLNKALKTSGQNSNALMLLAIVKFLSNDVQGSKEALRQAKPLVSIEGQSVCDLSLAFLLAFEGNLRDARKIYRKVINSKNAPSSRVMVDIFTFLAQVIEAYPQKPQIRFVYALLNDEFGDKALAKEEFENYLAKIGDNATPDVGRWGREAKLRIDRI